MVRPKVKVQSFDHLTLVVSDLAASHQFYADFLGLQEAERPAFDFAGAWYRLGPVFLHLIVASNDAGLPGPGNRNVNVPSRGQHFAFQVDDANAAAEVIREADIPIVVGPKSRPDGATQVYIHDPDGHLVEIFSMPNQ